MDDRYAHGYVLTLQLAADGLTPEVVDHIVRDLAHLSAAKGPFVDDQLVLHCTVSAPSEPDAVRYAASRAVSALVTRGAESPRVLAVESSLFDHQAV